jgi:hypothetical protein
MSHRRNHFKALALLAVVSVTAAGSAAGQGYAGPVLTPAFDFGSVLQVPPVRCKR